MKFMATEWEAIERTRKVISQLAQVSREVMGVETMEPDWLVIRGDHERFIECAQRQKKSWMHVQTEKLPETNGPKK